MLTLADLGGGGASCIYSDNKINDMYLKQKIPLSYPIYMLYQCEMIHSNKDIDFFTVIAQLLLSLPKTQFVTACA